MLPTERGRELDAAVAVEVLGLPDPTRPRYGYATWLQSYSSDAREARFMEAHIGVIGLSRQYIRYMLAQVDDADLYWQLLRATPESRCLAALAAVREVKGGTE